MPETLKTGVTIRGCEVVAATQRDGATLIYLVGDGATLDVRFQRQAGADVSVAVYPVFGTDSYGPFADGLTELEKGILRSANRRLWEEARSAADRDRVREPITALDIAETAAMLELERTPFAPARLMGRPDRTCAECGSPVYGEHCTHCFES